VLVVQSITNDVFGATLLFLLRRTNLDRPSLVVEQIAVVARDIESISDVTSRHVHAVDVVRQPPR